VHRIAHCEGQEPVLLQTSAAELHASSTGITAARRIRLLIADNHRIHREAVKRLLDNERDFRVIGEPSTAVEAARLSGELRPDILLYNSSLGGWQSREFWRDVTARGTRVILMTPPLEDADILSALQLGARGVITSDADSAILFRSIRKVAAGEYWISRSHVADLVSAFRRLSLQSRAAAEQRFRLTPREREMISAVVSGRANREIARQFSISEQTVKRHLTNIFDKLGVSNRVELALFAVHNDLLVEP
jgi:DNA-binding NarL/FixJ family response regulator